MGGGHVAVDADGHGEGARARAGTLLVQHHRRAEVGAAPAVLLVVFDTEEPELAQARPDRPRHPAGRFPLLDVRHDLALDELPDRCTEPFVLTRKNLEFTPTFRHR